MNSEKDGFHNLSEEESPNEMNTKKLIMLEICQDDKNTDSRNNGVSGNDTEQRLGNNGNMESANSEEGKKDDHHNNMSDKKDGYPYINEEVTHDEANTGKVDSKKDMIETCQDDDKSDDKSDDKNNSLTSGETE